MTPPTAAPPRPSRPPLLSRAGARIEHFAFSPASAAPLAALRIGLATVLLLQAALVAPALFELYGRWGILQGSLRDVMSGSGLPSMEWLVGLFAPLGVNETVVIAGTGLLYGLSLLALLVGWRTRIAAVLAWLTHLMLMTSASTTTYGTDNFAHIFLSYLVLMPSGAVLSLDRRARRAPPSPSPMARFWLRVMQVHLSIVYLASGLQKALGEQWWNGEAIWRSLMLPEFRQYDFSWLASHPTIAAAMGWTVLLVEIGYPVLIWPRRTRRLWLAATVGLHLGIIVFMGLTVFGAVMIALNIAAFGVRAEPRAPSLHDA